MYSSIITGAVHGLDSYLMRVETDISNGLPSFNMVGFISVACGHPKERDHCRPAHKHWTFSLPRLH